LKIENDKYYTPMDLAKYCISKTYEIIGKQNITEAIEPSAGNGSFSNQIEGCMAYDIEPENKNIIKQDYMTLSLDYKKGRLIIGNPPYGRTGKGSVKFFNKSVLLGDYVAFILPITQLNNNYDFFKFDFVYSEDLGIQKYSDRDLHCCLNIFKRPIDGKLFKREKNELNDIEVMDYQRTRTTTHERTIKLNFNYDLRICGYGSGIVGKEVEYEGQYLREICVKVNNEKLKTEIIKTIKNANWEKICYGMSGQITIAKWRLYKYLKEQIPEIS